MSQSNKPLRQKLADLFRAPVYREKSYPNKIRTDKERKAKILTGDDDESRRYESI